MPMVLIHNFANLLEYFEFTIILKCHNFVSLHKEADKLAATVEAPKHPLGTGHRDIFFYHAYALT